MTWGPFLAGLDRGEVRSRLRCVRLARKILCGSRSADARAAFLRAEIDPASDTLGAAEAAFEAMPALDRRRVLSAYVEVA